MTIKSRSLDDRWCPIDLKWINKLYIVPPHFRMDMLSDVAFLLRFGDWAASKKNACFSFSRSLPSQLQHIFSLAGSALSFSWMHRPLHFYEVDIASCSISSYHAVFAASFSWTISSLGRRRNVRNVVKKSNLAPSQLFRYLGLI